MKFRALLLILCLVNCLHAAKNKSDDISAFYKVADGFLHPITTAVLFFGSIYYEKKNNQRSQYATYGIGVSFLMNFLGSLNDIVDNPAPKKSENPAVFFLTEALQWGIFGFSNWKLYTQNNVLNKKDVVLFTSIGIVSLTRCAKRYFIYRDAQDSI